MPHPSMLAVAVVFLVALGERRWWQTEFATFLGAVGIWATAFAMYPAAVWAGRITRETYRAALLPLTLALLSFVPAQVVAVASRDVAIAEVGLLCMTPFFVWAGRYHNGAVDTRSVIASALLGMLAGALAEPSIWAPWRLIAYGTLGAAILVATPTSPPAALTE